MKTNRNYLVKFAFIFVSFIVVVISIIKSNNGNYKYITLIPLSFCLCSIVFSKLYEDIPNNFGITTLLLLQFFRSVIYILIYELSGYYSRFPKPVNDSIQIAIFLMTYENIAIFITLFLIKFKSRKIKEKMSEDNIFSLYDTKKMNYIIFILLSLFILTIIIVPESIKIYKTFLQINDSQFTSLDTEVSSIVSKYGTTFVRKLVLVIHTYLMKILRFLVPLHLIVLVYKKDKYKKKYILCCFISLITLLVLDGSIARSLIYCFSLLYICALIYKKKKSLYKIIMIAAIAIFAYFMLRLSISSNKQEFTEYLSGLFGAYFSGLNNTAAVVRLDSSLSEKLLYFGCDYFQSIPFGNTIFRVSNVSFQSFYNKFNGSYGQIPTTIGLGYYYFGFLLSPLYSILFTILSYKFGAKASYTTNVFVCGIYSYAALICSMAIVMYYVQISITSLIGVVLPLVIIALLIKNKKATFNIDEVNYESFTN